MAGRKKNDLVGGFEVYKAAQKAAQDGHLSSSSSDAKDKVASRVKSRVMPTKQEVVCYQCGFSFEISGRTDRAVCSKCRARLNVVPYEIEGEWEEDITTAGPIHIKPDAVIKKGLLTGNQIILEGKVDGGKIHASRRLIFHQGYHCEEKDFAALDLVITEGVDLTLQVAHAEYRHVEIAGTLQANLTLTGTIHVHQGACFKGRVQAANLSVEEGAGLLGDININPEYAG